MNLMACLTFFSYLILIFSCLFHFVYPSSLLLPPPLLYLLSPLPVLLTFLLSSFLYPSSLPSSIPPLLSPSFLPLLPTSLSLTTSFSLLSYLLLSHFPPPSPPPPLFSPPSSLISPLLPYLLSPLSSGDRPQHHIGLKKKVCPECSAPIARKCKKCPSCGKRFGVFTFGRRVCTICRRINLARMTRCFQCSHPLYNAPKATPDVFNGMYFLLTCVHACMCVILISGVWPYLKVCSYLRVCLPI